MQTRSIQNNNSASAVCLACNVCIFDVISLVFDVISLAIEGVIGEGEPGLAVTTVNVESVVNI